MTEDQAYFLVGKMRSFAPPQDLPDDRVKAMTAVLMPLPFEVADRRVDAWGVQGATDRDGKRAAKWVSTPDDVLDAVGVAAGGARRLLDLALAEERELWPSLRGEGWELADADGTLPRGVGEWHANLGLPLPAGRPLSMALLAAPIVTNAEPTDARSALVRINASLQERKAAALRQAMERVQHPQPAAVPDLNAMPTVLREAVEAAEMAQDRAIRAEQRCIAQERYYHELCAEMTDRIRDAAPDLETAKAVAQELLERIVADPLGGVPACIEVFRAAVAPDLVIDGKSSRVERGENPDVFGDGAGPVVGLRVALRRA